MPWEVGKVDNQFCVFKQKEDGSRGERESCHSTRDKANAAMAALYASESDDGKSASDIILSVIKSFDVGQPDAEEDPPAKNHPDNKNHTPEEDPQPESKPMKMSFDEHIRMVRKAWRDEYEYRGYVVEVFPEHSIVSFGKKTYQVSYQMDDEMNISFAPENEWVEVEMKREWATKHFAAIKAIDKDKIGAYAILWGDESQKDLDRQFFDEKTEELTAVFKSMGGVPFLFNHATDEVLKSSVIGVVDTLEEDDVGLWFEAKIKEHELYKEFVKPLIDKKALYPSSGALPGGVKVKKNGHIKRWPIIEVTGTHVPAEYRMLDVPIEQVKHAYKSAGLGDEFPEGVIDESEDSTKSSEEERLRLELDLMTQEADLLEIMMQ